MQDGKLHSIWNKTVLKQFKMAFDVGLYRMQLTIGFKTIVE